MFYIRNRLNKSKKKFIWISRKE